MVGENGDGEDGGGPPNQQVQDDGTVARKLKDRILDARARVDDREDYLYVEASVDNTKGIDEWEQIVYWGVVVKQYLRAIEPILKNEEIPESQDYYKEKEIGEVTLTPTSTEQYPFQKLQHNGMTQEEFKIQYDLPRDLELPSPVTKKFTGLKSVIEADEVVSHTWVIRTDQFTDPESGGVIETSNQQPIPKHIYEDAIRAADEFLQQAGIGLEIGSGRPNRNYSQHVGQ